MDVATDQVSLCWGGSGFSVLLLMLFAGGAGGFGMIEVQDVICNCLVMEYSMNWEHLPQRCITSNTSKTGSYAFIMVLCVAICSV